jgi:TatD DNase family protein
MDQLEERSEAPALIDTHCHLDFGAFEDDRPAVVQRAQKAGVKRLIVPAVNQENASVVLELADRYDLVYAAVGIHPNSTASWREDWIETVRGLAVRPKVVAIGEIGLDYYWNESPPDVQRLAFEHQLDLAAELKLPVIIHNREASDDVIRLLSASSLAGMDNPGVLHSFSSDWAIAKTALDLGFYLGFTGPLTYKKADALRDIARQAPLDRILIETDAPFLAPQDYRGRRNEPAYVQVIAERLAELHRIDYEEIAYITTQNALRLFRLPAWR